MATITSRTLVCAVLAISVGMTLVSGQPTIQASSSTLIVGQERTLACYITSPEQVTLFPISWTRRGVPVTASSTSTTPLTVNGATTYSYTSFYKLTVNASDNEDVVTCTATFPTAGSSAATFTIYVYKGPDTPILTGSTTVVSGRTSSWTCDVDGASNTAPSVYWEFSNGTRLVTGFNNTGLIYIDPNKLEIHKITSVATFYVTSGAAPFTLSCYAVHFETGTTTSAAISVTVYSPPQVNSAATNYTARAGTDVTLACSVVANPVATSVTWYRGGALVPTVSGRYSGSTPSAPSLTISSVVKADTGFYICSGANSIAATNGSAIYLDVTYVPVISYTTNLVGDEASNNVSLSCIIDSNPPVTAVYWYRVASSGGETQVNVQDSKYSGGTAATPTLTINRLISSDAGLYKCVADNLLGRGQGANLQVQVYYPPIVNIGSNKFDVDLGVNVTLPCSYDAFPLPHTIVWLRDRRNVTVPSADGRLTGGSITSPALSITKTRANDTGTYKCDVYSSLSMGSTGDIILYVRFAPEVTVPQTLYTQKAGSGGVTLLCSQMSYPIASSVTWLRNGVPLNPSADPGKYSGATPLSPSLALSRLTAADGGNYTCRVTNQVGARDGDVIKLDVQYAPVMILNATSYTSNVTQTLTIPCYYDANPAPTNVQWTKNSQLVDVISSGGKYAGSTVSVPSLTIRQTTRSDAGVYVCSANNSIGPGISSDITVSVQYPPEFNATSATQLDVSLGANVTLTCQASASPAPTAVLWFKGGVRLDVSSSLRYSGGTVSTPGLTITGLQKNDTDPYMCSVTNALGTTNSSAVHVNVQYPPKIVSASSPQFGVESSALTVPCTYDANPVPDQIAWTKDGATLNTSSPRYAGGTRGNPSLNIQSLVLSDTGSYKCNVTSSLGSASSGNIVVTVTYVPKVSTGAMTNLSLDEGQNVTIPCVIDAVPSVTSVRWLKAGSVLNTTDPSKYGAVTVATPSLTVRALKNTDAAVYACEATNTEGTGRSGSVTLVVIFKPIVSVPNSITAREQDRVVIPCTVTAVPALTSLSWYKGGRLLDTSNASLYLGATAVVPSLTLVSVQASDEGAYHCLATNPAGSTNSSASVLVVHYLPILKLTQTQVGAMVGQTVTLSLTVNANPPLSSLTWRRKRPTESGFSDVDLGTPGNKYVGGTTTSPSLQISGLSSNDTGEYVAVANNTVGSRQTAAVSVAVSYAPTAASVNGLASSYREGDPISLTCVADGFPTPGYRWFKGTSPTPASTNATYTLTSAQNTDNGKDVKCQAYNSEGSIESTVRLVVFYKAKPGPTLTNQTAAIGDFVTLICATDSNPAPTNYTWTHNGKVVLQGPTADRLTVEVTNASALGAYVCSATNSLGTSNPIVVYINKTADNGGGLTGQSTQDTGGLSTTIIVLIVIICVIILVVAILIIIFCCTKKGCCKKKEPQQQGQRVGPAPVVIKDGGSYSKTNGHYQRTAIPAIAPTPRHATPKVGEDAPITASAKPAAFSGRIDLDGNKNTPPVISNGHAPLGHGLTISLPGGTTSRPHHLPPLGHDGGAQEAEPAEEVKPKKKRRKHRRRREGEGEGEDFTFSSPQHDPDV